MVDVVVNINILWKRKLNQIFDFIAPAFSITASKETESEIQLLRKTMIIVATRILSTISLEQFLYIN